MTFFPRTSCSFSFPAGRPRTVVHLNIADFAVAVERQGERRLKDYPVIIAPENAARAVVYDMSDEAFRAGVRKEMPLTRAIRRCRDAIIVPPHPDRYEQAMHDLLRHVLPYSPLVEPGEADGHVFVDTTGTSRLFGPSVDVAWRMYREIKKNLGFTPIWSVSPNKLVAKVASRLVKPTGEYIVGDGEVSDFLAPLPIFLIPGIEKNDWHRLKELNMDHVYQVAALTRNQLAVPFGKRAGFIHDLVRGIDPSPVTAIDQHPPIITADHAFSSDTSEISAVETVLYQLTEKIGRKLRKQGKAARMLAMRIDYADGVRCIRQMKVNPPTANDILLFTTARSLLHLAWTRRVRVRRFRLTCEKPVFPPAQLDLFPDPVRHRQEKLVAAMDRIRNRFGREMICMGRALAS